MRGLLVLALLAGLAFGRPSGTSAAAHAKGVDLVAAAEKLEADSGDRRRFGDRRAGAPDARGALALEEQLTDNQKRAFKLAGSVTAMIVMVVVNPTDLSTWVGVLEGVKSTMFASYLFNPDIYRDIVAQNLLDDIFIKSGLLRPGRDDQEEVCTGYLAKFWNEEDDDGDLTLVAKAARGLAMSYAHKSGQKPYCKPPFYDEYEAEFEKRAKNAIEAHSVVYDVLEAFKEAAEGAASQACGAVPVSVRTACLKAQSVKGWVDTMKWNDKEKSDKWKETVVHKYQVIRTAIKSFGELHSVRGSSPVNAALGMIDDKIEHVQGMTDDPYMNSLKAAIRGGGRQGDDDESLTEFYRRMAGNEKREGFCPVCPTECEGGGTMYPFSGCHVSCGYYCKVKGASDDTYHGVDDQLGDVWGKCVDGEIVDNKCEGGKWVPGGYEGCCMDGVGAVGESMGQMFAGGE